VNDMFETLARRSKSLVDHQLTLIEAMEYDEKDPRLLENLFRLDHLAAGLDSPKAEVRRRAVMAIAAVPTEDATAAPGRPPPVRANPPHITTKQHAPRLG
uniref:hypothetical protein n=1 Tax=Nocardia cyriacigeorgica TaxID=135487 RepID=UPI0024564D5B